MTSNPTRRTYDSLQAAYDHFNRDLFDGQLPPCLITVQRHKGAYGYFSGGRFASTADPHDIADEIALNPMHFAERTAEQTLSTLAHEMVHLWQHHFGKRPRKSYHDRQWAAKMREIGLLPTATGAPGGKETGQKVTHLIEEGGRFAVSCAAFLATHPAALYQDRAARRAGRKPPAKRNSPARIAARTPGAGPIFICFAVTAMPVWSLTRRAMTIPLRTRRATACGVNSGRRIQTPRQRSRAGPRRRLWQAGRLLPCPVKTRYAEGRG